MRFRKCGSVARIERVLVALPVLLLAWVVAERAALAFGTLDANDVQVNTYTTFDQGHYGLSVAADAAGNFVVVWDDDYEEDGHGAGVFAQRYDSTGAPVGPEFQVNSYTTGNQGSAGLSVAADAAGNFVVVWSSDSAHDGSDDGIFGQRFDSLGNPVGGEFQVNSYTTGSQSFPGPGIEVASDPTGNFVVVWSGQGPGDTQGIFARRFDSLANPLGGDFLVNTYTPGDQGAKAGATVAVDPTGNFVVVWDSVGQDGDGEGIFGQRFNSAGTAVGPEFQVNTYTTNDQGDPSLTVAVAPSGNFVVAWNSYKQIGGPTECCSDVFAQRFDSTGKRLGGEFQVNTYTTYQQGPGGYQGSRRGVGVAADPAGNFLVVWDSNPGGNDFGILGQRYDSAGKPLGGEFDVNAYSTSQQFIPAVAADGAGRFVVAWASNCDGCEDGSQDGSYFGVFRRRFGEGGTSLIAGRRMSIRDPIADESRRAVVVAGKERASDIATIAGNPVANGATLRIIANGTTDSDQTFVLDSAGWKATRSGFRYRGPTGADGDPVSRVTFSRRRSRTVVLKASLKGRLGTQALNVVPPNTGDSGGAILTINGGGTYCIAFGGGAGGVEALDNAQFWRINNATAQPGCPAP